jgi:hypothetical protein
VTLQKNTQAPTATTSVNGSASVVCQYGINSSLFFNRVHFVCHGCTRGHRPVTVSRPRLPQQSRVDCVHGDAGGSTGSGGPLATTTHRAAVCGYAQISQHGLRVVLGGEPERQSADPCGCDPTCNHVGQLCDCGLSVWYRVWTHVMAATS